MPHIFGYARASDDRMQILSPERQEQQIGDRAKQLEAEDPDLRLIKIRVDRASGSKVKWNKRLEFVKLMDELQKDDHLIVWRLDRLDRGWNGIVSCLDWLVTRGVNVHVLEHGKMQLDLTTAIGRLLVSFLAGMAAFESDRLSESVKAAMAYCRRNGLPGGGAVGFGRKRHLLPKRPGERKRRKRIVWSDKECKQIREIYDRKQAGEALGDIAIDFFHRGETTGDGKLWVFPGAKRLNRNRVYRVWGWYNRLLNIGLDLGCDVTDERMLAVSSK